MKLRKTLVNRAIHTRDTINQTDEEFKSALIKAFADGKSYPGYVNSREVIGAWKLSIGCGFGTPTPSVIFTVSDFNPDDLSVEITIAEHHAKAITERLGKPMCDVDVLTAWITTNPPTVMAFHFESPQEPTNETEN